MELHDHDNQLTTALDRARENLEEQVAAIRGLSTETEKKLRDALMSARAKLFEQAQVIEEISGAPTLHATVLGVVKDDVTIYAQDSAQNQKPLKRGMKMRVLKSNYIGEVGSVRDFDRSRVVLEFDGDRRHTYEYYSDTDGQQCALRVRGTGSQKPSDFVRGTLIERVEDKRWGKVMSNGPDGSGEVEVEWRNERGYTDWEFVGYTENRNEIEPAEKLRVLIAIDGKVLEVPSMTGYNLKTGDMVRVSQENLAILGKVEGVVQAGPLASVITILDDKLCEVSVDDVPRVVFSGSNAGAIEVGTRVMLDVSSIVVVKIVPDKKSTFTVKALPKVRWDDIGGLQDAKTALREVIELPLEHPDIFKYYGTKPAKGALLYGPPGCGKTMLGKATVNSIAEHHGRDAIESAFIYVKGPEVLEHLVGKGEANVRELFARARKHKAQYGYPAVVFIDEADAILRKRGTGISSDISDTIVPMFLAEMDGLDEVEAFVLLATNRPDTLDPAVVRDGRIDRKIKITRPDFESSKSIFGLHLGDVPLSNGYTHEALADFGATEIFIHPQRFYTLKRKGTTEDTAVTLRDFINGGMIAGIVERAKMSALQRDLKAGTRTGLALDDLRNAVCDSVRENWDLDHTDVLNEMTTHYGDVAGIERAPIVNTVTPQEKSHEARSEEKAA
jgi:proteasome-associated ATPase